MEYSNRPDPRDLQASWELDQLSNARERYIEDADRQDWVIPAVDLALSKSIKDGSEIIQQHIQTYMDKARTPAWALDLSLQDSSRLSSMVFKVLLGSTLGGLSKTATIDMLADGLYYNAQLFVVDNPDLRSFVTRTLKKRGKVSVDRKAVRLCIERLESAHKGDKNWKRVALTIFRWLFGNTNNPGPLGHAITYVRGCGGAGIKSRPSSIFLHEDLMATISENHEIYDIPTGWRGQPMVCRPIDHELPQRDSKGKLIQNPDNWGGYVTQWLRRPTIPYYSEPSQLCIDALNAMQSVPLAVNKRVLKVAEKLWENNIKVGKLAKRLVTEIPEDTPDDLKAKLKGLKKNESSARAECLRRFNLARELVRYGNRHYVPLRQDFRTRNVTDNTQLTFLGNDLDRGLVVSHEAVAQTEEGRRQMKISISNHVGEDKLSFDGRVKFFDDNMERWKRINADPLKHMDDWKDVDYPWQLIASIFDYFRTDGLTNVFIGIDGSNNALQWMAAVSRDHKIAPFVNLVKGAKPGDFYQYIADKMQDTLQSYASGDTELSSIFPKLKSDELCDDDKHFLKKRLESHMKLFLLRFPETNKVPRKLMKVPCMAIAYDSKAQSRVEGYVNDDPCYAMKTHGFQENGSINFTDEEWPKVIEDSWFLKYFGKTYHKKRSAWVRSMLFSWDKLFEYVLAREASGIFHILAFYKEAARLMGDQDKQLRWNRGDGAWVSQDYWMSRSTEVTDFECKSSGKSLGTQYAAWKEPVLDEDGKKILNTKDNKQGASANKTHSMDAWHMNRVAVRFTEEVSPIHQWVHDSFLTLGPMVPKLHQITREEFHAIVSDDQLMNFYNDIKSQLHEDTVEWQPFVRNGEWVPSSVLEATYFFA